MMILPEQTLETAIIAADRMRRAIEALAIPHVAHVARGIVTISAGVAGLALGENKSVEALINEADAALYRAKEAGRNRVTALADRVKA